MSETVRFADELRGKGTYEASRHVARLWTVAEEEAAQLLERLGRAGRGRGGPLAAVLEGHFDAGELAGAVFRHALHHAGLVGPKGDADLDSIRKGFKPYAVCPRCGADLSSGTREGGADGD